MNSKNNLQHKIIDYKRFGFTLLALSVFLYLGVVIPAEGKTILKTYILMGGTVVLLSASLMFFMKSNRFKKELQSLDEE